MINELVNLLQEYGWGAEEIMGQVTGEKYVFTYYNPEFDESLKIPITLRQGDKWLFVSTHKLFKYKAHVDVLAEFLMLNSRAPYVKWFIRNTGDEVYINIGFEIFETDYDRDHLFNGLDVLTYLLDETIGYLKDQGKLYEDTLTYFTEITKQSLELD